jgi:SOS-response transcriptional repressor LexA
MFDEETGDGYPLGSIVKVELGVEAKHGDNIIARSASGNLALKQLRELDGEMYLAHTNPSWPGVLIEVGEGLEMLGIVSCVFISNR